jgi:endonuclease III
VAMKKRGRVAPKKVRARAKPAKVKRGARVKVDPRKVAEAAWGPLVEAIPSPKVELDFGDAWQLLVATILSAQSTDARINQVTPRLFELYPTPAALASAPQEEVEQVVKSTGFFRNKAKAIRAASAMLVERFGGEVPRTVEGMVQLPGVARKTANMVLSNALGVHEGIAVDTHVGRVARRLGLCAHEDPMGVEEALCALFPKEQWPLVALRLQLHGRYVCIARAPDCKNCPVNEVCPSREAPPEDDVHARAARERARIPAR